MTAISLVNTARNPWITVLTYKQSWAGSDDPELLDEVTHDLIRLAIAPSAQRAIELARAEFHAGCMRGDVVEVLRVSATRLSDVFGNEVLVFGGDGGEG